jgi:hypothetical protein
VRRNGSDKWKRVRRLGKGYGTIRMRGAGIMRRR